MPDVAALTISIIALALSVMSLGWQMLSWNWSGPVVKVTTGSAFPTYGDQVGDHHIYVKARNKGRAPVQVTTWSLQTPSGQSLVQTQPLSFSTPLPHTLSNGAEAAWYMRRDALDERCAELGVRNDDLLAEVTLGTGVVVQAQWRGIGRPNA